MQLLIICILVWLVALMRSGRSGFESRPSNTQATQYASELVANQAAIMEGMTSARQKMHWIDSITYEDARRLIADNNLNQTTALKIISS